MSNILYSVAVKHTESWEGTPSATLWESKSVYMGFDRQAARQKFHEATDNLPDLHEELGQPYAYVSFRTIHENYDASTDVSMAADPEESISDPVDRQAIALRVLQAFLDSQDGFRDEEGNKIAYSPEERLRQIERAMRSE